MLKCIITYLLILTFGQVSAQRLFYLRPKLEVRTHHTATDLNKFTNLFSNNGTYASNPYYRAEGIKSFMMGGFQLGLNVGYELPGGDFLEVGYNQDASATSFRVIGFSSIPNEIATYGTGKRAQLAAGLTNTRFEFLYYKRRKTDRYHKNFHLNNSYFVLGTGFKTGKLQSSFSSLGPLQGYDSVSLSITSETRGRGGVSPFLSLGVSADINFNKKYWFSTSVIYTQGCAWMVANRHRVIVQDGTNTITYLHNTYSNGTGLQFQISRRFQVYPWKGKKKN